MARVDSCRGQESVSTLSEERSQKPILPEVRLLAPSTASSPAISSRACSSASHSDLNSNASFTKSSAEENIDFDESAEEEEEEEEVTENSKRRHRRHLLPSSFLNLLPPGTPRSGRKSGRGGRRSNRPHSAAAAEKTRHNKEHFRHVKRHNSDRETSSKNEGTSNCSSPQPISGTLSPGYFRRGRRSPSGSPRATSPTTFCPTISAALWRPLWPPGETLTLGFLPHLG